MGCAEANLFHRGIDLIDGIFFDTGSVRTLEATDQETEDKDIQAHTEVVKFVKNLFRDYTLDREAVVITNVGGSGNCLNNLQYRFCCRIDAPCILHATCS